MKFFFGKKTVKPSKPPHPFLSNLPPSHATFLLFLHHYILCLYLFSTLLYFFIFNHNLWIFLFNLFLPRPIPLIFILFIPIFPTMTKTHSMDNLSPSKAFPNKNSSNLDLVLLSKSSEEAFSSYIQSTMSKKHTASSLMLSYNKMRSSLLESVPLEDMHKF